jgi:acetyl esterase/lipase
MQGTSEVLSYGEHPEQYLVWYRPSSAAPQSRLAVLLHGGFWKAKYSLSNAGTRPVADALLARGWHVVDVEYRRVGHEGGGWPGTNEDVLAALVHIRGVMPQIVRGRAEETRVAVFGCAQCASCWLPAQSPMCPLV